MSSLLSHVKLRFAALARSPRKAVQIAAALAVPAILAVLLVSALAPALDRADQVPVAVVNLDEGSEGARLVESLVGAEEVRWSETGEDEAVAGLADGSFALALVIPEDYSEKVGSVEGDHPQKASVDVVSDGTGNVLATRAGAAAMRQVQSRLKTDLGERYLLHVLNDVRGQASRLTLTADGSAMLDAGYDALSDGADTIASALAQTATGATQLTAGLGQMGEAVTAAGAGAATVSDGLAALQERAAAPLAEGAEALSAGMDTLSGQLSVMGQGATGLKDGIALLEQVVSLDAGTASDADKLKGLERQAETLSEALATVNGAMDKASAAAGRAVSAVSEEAQDDAREVASGLDGLSATFSSAEGELGIAEQAGALSLKLADIQAKLSALAGERSGGGGFAVDAPAVDDEAVAVMNEAIALIATAKQDADAMVKSGRSGKEVADRLAAAAHSVASDLEGASSAAADLEAAEANLAAAQDAAIEASSSVQATATEGARAINALRFSVNGAQAILAGKNGMTLSVAASGLEAGVSALATQLSSEGVLGQGASALATGASALDRSLSPLSAATGQIAQSVSTLGGALSGMGSGASGFGTGLSALSVATGQLSGGVSQLKDASGQMSSTVGRAADALADVSSDGVERAEAAASPVAFSSVRNNEVEGPASAFAPALAALALWLGSLASMALLSPFDPRAALAGRALSSAVGSLASYALLGTAQAVLVGAACVLLGGVAPAEPAAFWGLLVLGAVAFSAVAQAVRAVCGRWGMLVSAALLALQLACAGVILPEALTVSPFDALGAWLPVPLLATALRGAVSGTLAGGDGAVLLAVFALTALVVTTLSARAHRTVRPECLTGA